MSTVQTEQVMVVKTELFRSCGYFQGFSNETEKYLITLLDPANTQYLPRGDMEEDPSFKQLIPYCIFQHIAADGTISVFQYTRGRGAGEARLHSKKSVGIGGHISTLDADDPSPYDLGMQRELDEEIAIDTTFTQERVGMINDDETEVGKVHLGVVHLFTVAEPKVSPREDEIIEAGFVPVNEMLEQLDEFESWSSICLKALFG